MKLLASPLSWWFSPASVRSSLASCAAVFATSPSCRRRRFPTTGVSRSPPWSGVVNSEEDRSVRDRGRVGRGGVRACWRRQLGGGGSPHHGVHGGQAGGVRAAGGPFNCPAGRRDHSGELELFISFRRGCRRALPSLSLRAA